MIEIKITIKEVEDNKVFSVIENKIQVKETKATKEEKNGKQHILNQLEADKK